VGDAARALPRHAETRKRDDGDELVHYRLGDDRVGLDVRDETYARDANGRNNDYNGALLAFVGYGLRAGHALEVRRERDACEYDTVRVAFTGDPRAAEAFDEAFHRDLARMSRAEIAALVALRRVPSLPDSMGFEPPRRLEPWHLKPPSPAHVELAKAALDALAPVATDAHKRFWCGLLRAKLGDSSLSAADLVRELG